MTADGDDADLQAAEYVIGTLDAAERAAFAERLAGDAVAREAVAAWERRLAPLPLPGGGIEPSTDVWARIEAAIETPPARQFSVIEGGQGDAATSSRLRRSRNRWRGATAAAAAIAAMLVAFVVVHDVLGVERAPLGVTYVAAINRGGDKPALIVTVDMRTRQVVVRPVAVKAPAGHSLELWYIGAGAAPRSLGLVSEAAERLAVPGGTLAGETTTVAVSLEPPGGSPTGAPTGAVLYSGQLVRE